MTSTLAPWTQSEFKDALLAKGKKYHIYHPYHIAMHEGSLTRKQIQGWVANRFYYQVNIPIKDAAILSNCPEPAMRRMWIQRIIDHDGTDEVEGGIEAWIHLGEAVGLSRDEMLSQQHVLPGVRFAVDAYVNFARQASWQEAACSSLTELFAPKIHKQRLDNWPTHYPWIDQRGFEYFRKRLTEARRDVEHGLNITLKHFDTRALQERALEILQFKLDVLWSMADAMFLAYILEKPPYAGVEGESYD